MDETKYLSELLYWDSMEYLGAYGGGLYGGGLHGCRIGPSAETDRDAVPSVDDIDDQGELDLILRGEVGPERFVGARVSLRKAASSPRSSRARHARDQYSTGPRARRATGRCAARFLRFRAHTPHAC